MIAQIKNESTVTLLEKSVVVENGHIWHKVSYHGKIGYVAHWVHCKETVPSKRSDRTFYGDRLLNDKLAKVVVPKGSTMTALINKWYIRYKTQEYYQGAARRGWERISDGDNLKYIYNRCLAEGAPFELVFQSLIESNWYPHRNNSAGAAGYWQFIESTAEYYGLVVNAGRDDRLDIKKSTDAAIKYDKDLAKMFEKGSKSFSDKWCFALSAYNRGPGKVRKTFKECNGDFSKYPDKIATKYSETRNYVAKMFGLRKFLQEYVKNKYVVEVYKSPADLAYEGYIEKRKDLSINNKIVTLKVIQGMYWEEVALKSYGEDRDDAYNNGALKEIKQELKNLGAQ